MKDPKTMSVPDLQRNLTDCRNELCLRCGDYQMAHKGACDGCRWKMEASDEQK